MSSANAPNRTAHIPAWKRLGLKLKSAQEPEQPAGGISIKPDDLKRKRPIVAEDFATEACTPSKKSKSCIHLDQSSLPNLPVVPFTPQLSRKKSVTFTPDTKAEDGDSIKQLFENWVADQKAADPSFEFSKSNPAFQTPEAFRVEEDVDENLDEKERRLKRVQKSKPEKPQKSKKPEKPTKVTKVTKPVAEAPRPFLAYLKAYCESKSTWKFNKNHQNHLLKHAFDIKVVRTDHAEYLFEYVRGLQGGVRTRVRDTALAIKVKDQEDGAAGFPANMAGLDKKQQEYEDAMNEYVATMTAVDAPARLGYEEGVELGLSDVAMVGRVAKRKRAERILAELASSPEKNENGTVPISHEDKSKRLRLDDGNAVKIARKRKQRTVVDVESSSSESDSSDNEDEIEAEAEAGDKEGADESSSSSSSSSSGSGSEEEASGENEGGEDDEDEDSESSESSDSE